MNQQQTVNDMTDNVTIARLSMHTNGNINAHLESKLLEIFNSFPLIKLAILFGSMAQNGVKFDSDFDLAMQSDHVLTTKEKMQLTSDLTQQFMRPIDLIDLRTVGELLLGQILVKGRRIIGSDTNYGDLINWAGKLVQFKIQVLRKLTSGIWITNVLYDVKRRARTNLNMCRCEFIRNARIIPRLPTKFI